MADISTNSEVALQPLPSPEQSDSTPQQSKLESSNALNRTDILKGRFDTFAESMAVIDEKVVEQEPADLATWTEADIQKVVAELPEDLRKPLSKTLEVGLTKAVAREKVVQEWWDQTEDTTKTSRVLQALNGGQEYLSQTDQPPTLTRMTGGIVAIELSDKDFANLILQGFETKNGTETSPQKIQDYVTEAATFGFTLEKVPDGVDIPLGTKVVAIKRGSDARAFEHEQRESIGMALDEAMQEDRLLQLLDRLTPGVFDENADVAGLRKGLYDLAARLRLGQEISFGHLVSKDWATSHPKEAKVLATIGYQVVDRMQSMTPEERKHFSHMLEGGSLRPENLIKVLEPNRNIEAMLEQSSSDQLQNLFGEDYKGPVAKQEGRFVYFKGTFNVGDQIPLPNGDVITIQPTTKNGATGPILAEGGFKTVYKGIDQNGTERAVMELVFRDAPEAFILEIPNPRHYMAEDIFDSIAQLDPTTGEFMADPQVVLDQIKKLTGLDKPPAEWNDYARLLAEKFSSKFRPYENYAGPGRNPTLGTVYDPQARTFPYPRADFMTDPVDQGMLKMIYGTMKESLVEVAQDKKVERMRNNLDLTLKDYFKETDVLKKYQGATGVVQLVDTVIQNATNHPVDKPDYNRFVWVAELLQGEDLQTKLEAGPMSVDESLALFSKLCDSVDNFHTGGYYHNDIKPGNFQIAPNGDVTLLDVGSAASVTGKYSSARSPSYVAPEGYRTGTSSPQTEVYSLGTTLFEMLTAEDITTIPNSYDGRLEPPVQFDPATGEPAEEVHRRSNEARINAMVQKLEGMVDAAGQRTVPDEIVKLVKKSLSFDPADRYQSPAEMKQDLDASLTKAQMQANFDQYIQPHIDSADQIYNLNMAQQGMRLPPAPPEVQTALDVLKTTVTSSPDQIIRQKAFVKLKDFADRQWQDPDLQLVARQLSVETIYTTCMEMLNQGQTLEPKYFDMMADIIAGETDPQRLFTECMKYTGALHAINHRAVEAGNADYIAIAADQLIKLGQKSPDLQPLAVDKLQGMIQFTANGYKDGKIAKQDWLNEDWLNEIEGYLSKQDFSQRRDPNKPYALPPEVDKYLQLFDTLAKSGNTPLLPELISHLQNMENGVNQWTDEGVQFSLPLQIKGKIAMVQNILTPPPPPPPNPQTQFLNLTNNLGQAPNVNIPTVQPPNQTQNQSFTGQTVRMTPPNP